MAESKLTVILGLRDQQSNGLNKAIMSFMGLNQAIELGKKAYQLLSETIKETIGLAINQATAQKDLARQMGGTAQEAGILLKVSDDLKVSQGTLVLAFKTLNKAGIQPTFENLVKIAKQYQTLPTSVEKNIFATQTFGRAGVEMQKILETNITELENMGKAAMDSGEVLSGPVVDMMERFRKKLKDNSDAVQGLKTQIGVGFAAELEGMLGGAAEINAETRRIAVKNLLNEAEAQGIITTKELTEWRYKLQMSDKSGAQTTQFLDEKYQALNADMDHATHWIKDHTDAVKKNNEKGMEQLSIEDKWLQHMLAEKDVTSQLTAEQNRWAYNQITLNDLTARKTELTTQLQDAEKNLADTQANWNKSVGADSLSYLKDYVYNYGPKYTEALKANDEVWGTDSAVQYARNQALKDANAEYAKTNDLAAYKLKLTEIKDTYGPMDEAITAAKDAVLLLKDAMDRLVDKIIHIDIIQRWANVVATPGHPDVPSYPGKQFGGALVGEHGIEGFQPYITGHIVPNNQVNYSIASGAIQVNAAAGQNPYQIAVTVLSMLNHQIAAARNNRMGSTGK